MGPGRREDAEGPAGSDAKEEAEEDAERDASIRRANRAEDDEQVKRSLASNPPARDPGAPEPAWSAALDLFAEAALVALLAVPVTLLVLAVRRFPVPMAIGLGVLGVAALLQLL